MRILQVIPFFSPEMGGSVQVVYNLSMELSRMGHEVTVVTSSWTMDRSVFEEGGIEVVAFPVLFPWLCQTVGFCITPKLNSWISENIDEYDIIHLHLYRSFQNIVATRRALMSKISYILSPHGSKPYNYRLSFIKRIYDFLFGYKMVSGAAAIIANSTMEIQEIVDAHVKEDKISLIYNGINIDDYVDPLQSGKFKEMIGVSEGARIILGLGRIINYKGYELIIEAFSRVVKKQGDIVLVIVGPDGGGLSELRNVTESFGVGSKVFFPGPLYGKEKYEAYHDADVFVHSPLFESFGLVIIEALMCGIPVIVSDSAGVSDLILGQNAGVVVPFGDVDVLTTSITERLIDLAGNEVMVNNGQKMVRNLMSWSNVAHQTEKLYKQVIK